MGRRTKKLTKRTDLRQNVVDLAWYGDDFMDVVEQSTPDGLFRGGEVILEAARGRAPKRRGELVRSGFVLTEKRDNYVKGQADRPNIRKLMAVMRRPETVTIGFAAWYSNLFEDTGRKKNIVPKAYRKRGSSVRKAKRALRSGRLEIQSALKIPGIGYRAKVTIPRMRPRPSLGPAVEETAGEFVKAVAGDIRTQLESDMQ